MLQSSRMSLPAPLAAVVAALTGRRSKLIPLGVGIVVSAILLGLGGAAASSDDPTSGMPSGAESTAVVRLQERLPQARQQPAIVVYSRSDGALGGAERRKIDQDRRALARIAEGGKVAAPVFAPGDRAALLSVPLPSVPSGADGPAADRLNQQVKAIRRQVTDDLPDGARAQVTGPAGFQVDLANVFDGADGLLLGVTALVVALLLLITYRSPWLWLVPLTVIALADRVVSALLAILSREAGLVADGATTGIVSVLVFGAGTNYALLLIARYREELRRHEERHEAMRAALGHAAPAILASSSTVALSLSTLALAHLPFDRNIGLAGALGIVTAVVFVLGLLPPALLLFGRRLFWPLVPEYGDPDPARTGFWARIGTAVTGRPVPVTIASVALLVVLALGSIGASTGLSQSQQLRDRPDSVRGQETIARTFGPGSSEPAAIVVRADAVQDVTRVARQTPGVARVSPGAQGGGLAQLDAQLKAEPGSAAAFSTIKDLRHRLGAAPGDGRVGGQDASDLDKKDAAAADRLLIVPLVLAVVLLVLVALLRSIVAAVLLTLSNIISWAAALGASTWAFDHVFGFPGIDLPVPLLSFLFLVALGVDYNIFLITRTREEARTESTRGSVVTALASTGGVITSAGILLAAVFTVLGVLPIITLTQLGIVVGFGILLDTLLVRTVLVPAMVTLVGHRFWWPSSPRVGVAVEGAER
ncbi:MMPL family transporter [Conexibacter woesei]|uniref:MMPL family transporter n=1 Tax=Conexibacter woesei TaxID=191495 RepID=UPI0003FC0406|nr:MMPL family transporter [Conexibacter woesei]